MDGVIIELPVILRAIREGEDPNPMPFSILKFPFEFLPLVVLKCVEVIKYLWFDGAIWLELWVIKDPAAIVLILLPFALVDQYIFVDKSFPISIP